MKVKDIFSRKSRTQKTVEIALNELDNEIIFESEELKNFVKEWLENNNWKLADFSYVLRNVGVLFAFRVSEYNKYEKSFKCYTELEDEYKIYFSFGEISVERGDETKKFYAKKSYVQGESTKRIILHYRTVKRNGKTLNCDYYNDFVYRILKIDEDHNLTVKIDNPNEKNSIFEEFPLTNCLEVEDYLLSLDNTLIVAQVYNKLMQLLGVKQEEMTKCKRFSVSYNKMLEGKERILSRIVLVDGKMQEYAILENGETFHVIKDGSWRYLYNGISVIYFEERKQYVIQIVGDEESIVIADFQEFMDRIKEKISELWKFVK